MSAFYNEIDPFAAQMLRNLIEAGHIAPGVVDERSIEDITPAELVGYTQCHFFAGIAVWSLALRRAGWPDDRPVWTGSCPCQPFSSAGQGAGFADERHLWPAFYHLITQCHPESVFGEQVASKDADPWIDLVHTDMEALGYAFGAVPFPSAGIGAPHIRDRLYWVADSKSKRLDGKRGSGTRARAEERAEHGGGGDAGGLDHTGSQGHTGHDGTTGRQGSNGSVATASVSGGMANPHLSITEQLTGQWSRSSEAASPGAHDQPDGRGELVEGQPDSRPTNGLWADADWLLCRDGKWRPVEPGTFPLAHGAPARVGRLRAYGNAINAYQAQIFIESCI